MTIEATAQALATDADMSEDVAPEQTEDQELEAIFDKGEGEAPDPAEDAVEPDSESEEGDEAEEAVEEPEGEEEPEESEADEHTEGLEVPTDLPRAVRDAWKDIPESARPAILESQREMSRKLSEQGRLMQGIGPIRDSIAQAVKDIPQMANMRPQEVAQEVFQLAKISGDFRLKPVETVMSLVKQHGLEEPMRQALSGQAPQQEAMQSNQLRQKISDLERQLSQVSDPEYLRELVNQFTMQSQVQSEIEKFAQDAEYWGQVEDKMPAAIQFVQESAPSASSQDVLKRAYDLAVGQFVPEAKATSDQAAAQAATTIDPEKTQAAQKAKSVNVTGRTNGKPRKLTEDQELERAWKRMQD